MGGGKIGPTKLTVSHEFHSMKKKTLPKLSRGCMERRDRETERERGTGEAGKTTKKATREI